MEDALDGVKAYFDANLEAMLTTIASERSVTIPKWKSMDTAEIRSRQYLSIEILPDTTVPDYSDDESPLEEPWDYHNINVLITYAGNDAKDVQYTLLRYREAIKRLINGDGTFGDLFNRVRIGATDYSPMVEAQDNKKLVQIMFQDLEVRVYDD